MTQDKEQFSAWLDDAAAADGMLNASFSDESNTTLGLAARYRLIGDALRGEIEDNSMSDISASVRAAIEAEPAHHHHAPTTVRLLPVKKKAPLFAFGSWLRPVGGLALAASVAMIVVVTVNRPDTAATGGAEMVAASVPQPAMVVPVSYPAGGYAANQMTASPVTNLNEYIEEHSEYASQDTMQRIMPYTRAVSYENSR